MLKNSSPTTACTKSSSVCLKSATKNAASPCTKNQPTSTVTTNNIAKSQQTVVTTKVTGTVRSCKNNTNVYRLKIQNGGTPPTNGTCIKNNTPSKITATLTLSSKPISPATGSTAPTSNVTTASAKCSSNTKTPPPSVMRSMAANNPNVSTNISSTTATSTSTTNGATAFSNSTATTGTITCTNGGNTVPTKVENSELRIIIIDENWSQYCYRIKINTPFGKLINRFCQQVRKIDHKSVLFWYHGRLVEDDDTPKTLNIKDGEVILAHYIK